MRDHRASAGHSLVDLVVGPDRRGIVRAAFPDAAYVEVAGTDRVVAVVARDGLVLPNAAVVADLRSDGPLADEDAEVVVGSGAITIGDLRVRVDRWEDPRPVLSLPDDLGDRIESFAADVPAADDDLALRTDALAAAVAAADAEGALAAAGELIGRGGGLTPAGDDVLAGVVSAGRAVARAAGAETTDTWFHDLGGEVAALAVGRTTALSATLLWHAARGEVAVPARRVLRAVTGASPLQPAVGALLRVGHSSGRDLAEGMVIGLRAAWAAARAGGHHRPGRRDGEEDAARTTGAFRTDDQRTEH